MTRLLPRRGLRSTRRLRWLRVLVAVALLAGIGGGCGDASGEESTPPRPVPPDLVPAHLLGGELAVTENRAKSTMEALAGAEDTALVAETRVWEIRRGDRLVATLQISTVLPKVDLHDQDIRERFAAQVMLGGHSRLRVGDVEVFTTTSNDKTVFLWFGAHLFEVLQTKDRELVPAELLEDVIRFQHDKDGWEPIIELVDG